MEILTINANLEGGDGDKNFNSNVERFHPYWNVTRSSDSSLKSSICITPIGKLPYNTLNDGLSASPETKPFEDTEKGIKEHCVLGVN